MKTHIVTVLALGVGIMAGVSAPGDGLIKDPITDFLSLPIEYRYSEASSVVRVYKVTLDIDGDGVDDQWIGHNKMWMGDHHFIFFVAYKGIEQGFQRITSSTKDFAVIPGYLLRQFAFCGFVTEKQSEGLLVCEYGETKEVNPTSFPRRTFYHIKDGHLEADQLGPLDLSKSEDNAFYQKYFGEGVKSRPVVVTNMTRDELIGAGYSMPDWTVAPKATADSASSTEAAPSLQSPKVVTSAVGAKQPAPKTKSDQVEQPTIEQPQSTSGKDARHYVVTNPHSTLILRHPCQSVV